MFLKSLLYLFLCSSILVYGENIKTFVLAPDSSLQSQEDKQRGRVIQVTKDLFETYKIFPALPSQEDNQLLGDKLEKVLKAAEEIKRFPLYTVSDNLSLRHAMSQIFYSEAHSETNKMLAKNIHNKLFGSTMREPVEGTYMMMNEEFLRKRNELSRDTRPESLRQLYILYSRSGYTDGSIWSYLNYFESLQNQYKVEPAELEITPEEINSFLMENVNNEQLSGFQLEFLMGEMIRKLKLREKETGVWSSSESSLSKENIFNHLVDDFGIYLTSPFENSNNPRKEWLAIVSRIHLLGVTGLTHFSLEEQKNFKVGRANGAEKLRFYSKPTDPMWLFVSNVPIKTEPHYLRGVDLSDAVIEDSYSTWNRFDLRDANLNNSKLNLRGITGNFKRAEVKNAVFPNAQNCYFFQVDLEGTSFENSQLDGTDFTQANLKKVKFNDWSRGAQLWGTIFTDAKGLEKSQFNYLKTMKDYYGNPLYGKNPEIETGNKTTLSADQRKFFPEELPDTEFNIIRFDEDLINISL